MNSTNFARKACALLICASLSVAAFAQTQVIKGKIVDENGDPLVGVTIQEKGTNNGTITDMDGNYSIMAGARSTLQIRYVGYQQEDIAVNGKNIINVNLKSELEDLDEVVVVGYGAVKKRDLTGSVARVGADKLKERSYTNAMQSLQGQVSGVQITQSQGAPGLAPSIKVRGASSVNAGTTPLYVIDGIPLEDNSNSTGTNGGSYDFNRNPMNNINPNDIESIEILKDASSAAIYGSRGANGVVLITTRQGKSGKTKVDVNYEFGLSKVLRTMDMMDGPQWIEYESTARRNSYATAAKTNPALQPSASMANYYVPDEFSDATWLARIGNGTDWQDVVLRTAQTHNAQVSASGGNEKVQFLISTGLVDQDGVVDKTRYKRINVRSNITSQLNKNLKATLNLSFSRSDKVDHGTAGKSDVVSLAVQSDPIFPVRNEVGSLGFKDPSSIWYTFVKYGFQLWHPYSLTRESDKHKEQLNFLGNAALEWKVFDGLTFKTAFNTSIEDWQYKYHWNEGQDYGYSGWVAETGTRQHWRETNWAWENTLNYAKTFNEDHFVSALVGFTMQEDKFEYLSVTGAGYPGNDLVYTLNAATKISSWSNNEEEWSLASFIARANYSYKGRYLATASVRADGSSRFGSENPWGWFPSGSLAWRISDEPFMEGTKGWLDNLKLRMSYGVTGNNNIGNYGAIGLLKSDATYVENGSVISGMYTYSYPASDLKWEKTGQFDLGLDASFLGNRLGTEIDYYKSKTTDMLLDVPIPVLSGFTSSLQNIGEMQNWGMEFHLHGQPVVTRNFRWTSDFNISFNRNEVLKLGNNDAPIDKSWNSCQARTSVGDELFYYYGYKLDGVLSTEDINNSNLPKWAGSEAGDPKVVDVDGNGKIDSNDQTKLGSYQADFTWGWTNTFTFKGFDLTVMLTGVQGNEIMNQNARFLGFYNGARNLYASRSNFWKSDAEPGDGKTPKPRTVSNTCQQKTTDMWIDDGSFVRLKNIRLGYTFNKKVCDALHIAGLKLYCNLENVHVWSDYENYDPEGSTFQTGAFVGFDYGAYPNPFTATVGVNLSF